jgi:hypothetical protein
MIKFIMQLYLLADSALQPALQNDKNTLISIYIWCYCSTIELCDIAATVGFELTTSHLQDDNQIYSTNDSVCRGIRTHKQLVLSELDMPIL